MCIGNVDTLGLELKMIADEKITGRSINQALGTSKALENELSNIITELNDVIHCYRQVNFEKVQITSAPHMIWYSIYKSHLKSLLHQ